MSDLKNSKSVNSKIKSFIDVGKNAQIFYTSKIRDFLCVEKCFAFFSNLDLLHQNSLNFDRFLKVTEFHGHVCPGSAIGYRAAEIGIDEISSKKAYDE